MAERGIQIAIIGSGGGEDKRLEEAAEEAGREVARAGAILVCGGLGGVMEAAARGARREGGTTVGILPGYAHTAANPWLDVVIPTGMGHARNAVVVASGDAVVALAGGEGTLSEVFLALKIGRAVVVMGGWTEITGAAKASNPREAVKLALALARGKD